MTTTKAWKAFIFCTLSLIVCLPTIAQQVQVNERAAKKAVYRIVQYSGLEANFVVLENPSISTAIAYIKNKKRYVAFNPAFIASIVDSSKTNWSAISILAHEIAHHLLGHTINPDKVSPGDELACDKYSGFILRNMGASLVESLAAMRIAGNPHGTKTHPPTSSRLRAIEQGWRQPDELLLHGEVLIELDVTFKYRLRFEGDENNYYVTEKNKVVWFNNYAEPIEFGLFEALPEGNFAMRITWNEQSYFVDGSLNVWSHTAHGALSKVGSLFELEN